MHAFAAQPVQCRAYHLDFLIAQVPGFTACGFSPSTAITAVDAEIGAQGRMGDAQGSHQAVGSDRVGNCAQRQVGGGQGYAHYVIGQHHHYVAGCTHRQQLGGAGVGDASGVDGRLVHRAGHQPVEPPQQARIGSLLQRVDDRARVAWIGCAELAADRVGNDVQPKLTRLPNRVVPSDEVKRQAQQGGSVLQRFSIAKRHKVAIDAWLLGQPHAKFRAYAGRLARNQRKPGLHTQPPLAAGAFPARTST